MPREFVDGFYLLNTLSCKGLEPVKVIEDSVYRIGIMHVESVQTMLNRHWKFYPLSLAVKESCQRQKATFGRALEMLKEGKEVQRASWPAGRKIRLIRGGLADRLTSSIFHLELEDGSFITNWFPSCEDMLAEDWEIC